MQRRLPKRPSRKTLCDKADKLWSQLVLSKGRCEVCGRLGPGLNPHHVIGRKNLTLRHDPHNGCLLCYSHHVGSKNSAHNDPVYFLYWFMEHRPDDYNYLVETREELATNLDYEAVIRKLEEIIYERTHNQKGR